MTDQIENQDEGTEETHEEPDESTSEQVESEGTSEETHEEPVDEPEEEEGTSMGEDEATMSSFSRVINVFTKPKETFEDISRKSSWVIPLLLAMVIGLGVTFTLKPYILKSERIEETIEQLMETQDLSRRTAEDLMATQMTIGLPVQAIVFVPLILVILSGIILLVGNFVMGGEAKFKKLFAMIVHANLISTAGQVVMMFIIMAKGSMDDIYLSPAAFFPLDMKDDMIFKLFAVFDLWMILFSVWTAIGLAAVYKWEQKKANNLVYSLWGVFFVIYTGVLAIF